MKAGFIALIVIAMIVGIIIGVLIEKRAIKRNIIRGTINVDFSDPDKEPYLYLVPTISVFDIISQERVVFDVKVIGNISRK